MMASIRNLPEEMQNKLASAVCKVHSAAQQLDSCTVYEQASLEECIDIALEVESALEDAIKMLGLARAMAHNADKEAPHV